MNMRASLLYALQHRAYQYREEPFTLKSGKKSHHYIDCCRILLSSKCRAMAGRLMRNWIQLLPFGVDAVAGVVLGAVPLVDEITSQEQRDGGAAWSSVYVRAEAKEHGTKNRVEFSWDTAVQLKHREVRVVLVEDVTTTGGSIFRAETALKEYGFDVARVITLVDREEADPVRRPDYALFTLKEIIGND